MKSLYKKANTKYSTVADPTKPFHPVNNPDGYFPQTTKADSLALYNNALLKEKYYKDNPDYVEDKPDIYSTDFRGNSFRDRIIRQVMSPSLPVSVNPVVNQDLINDIKARAISQGKPLSGTEETAMQNKLGETRFGLVPGTNLYQFGDILYSTIDDIYNPLAPPIYLHPHIKPQGSQAYSSSKFGDRTEVPYYDPIAIAPLSILNDEQLRQRIEKYGKNSVTESIYTRLNRNQDIKPIPTLDSNVYLTSEQPTHKAQFVKNEYNPVKGKNLYIQFKDPNQSTRTSQELIRFGDWGTFSEFNDALQNAGKMFKNSSANQAKTQGSSSYGGTTKEEAMEIYKKYTTPKSSYRTGGVFKDPPPSPIPSGVNVFATSNSIYKAPGNPPRKEITYIHQPDKFVDHDNDELTPDIPGESYMLKRTITPYTRKKDIKRYTQQPTDPRQVNFLSNYAGAIDGNPASLDFKYPTSVPFKGEKHWNIDRFVIEPQFNTDFTGHTGDYYGPRVKANTNFDQMKANTLADMYKYYMLQNDGMRGKSFRQAKRFMRREINPKIQGAFLNNYLNNPLNKESDQFSHLTTFADYNRLKQADNQAMNDYVFGKRSPSYHRDPYTEDELKDISMDYFRNYRNMSNRDAKKLWVNWKDESQKNREIIYKQYSSPEALGYFPEASKKIKEFWFPEKEKQPEYYKGGLIKRADGSYSQRGLWDNIRANRGSGKEPTKQMLEQEKKIKAKYSEGGITSLKDLDPKTMKKYIADLKNQENDAKKGYTNSRWYPHASVEGGSDTIAYGHKILPNEDFSKGLSDYEAEQLLQRDVLVHQANAKKQIDNKYGEGTFNSLPQDRQMLLVDYDYNLGSLSKFPNFVDAAVKGNNEKMLKEYVRYSGGKPLKKRNDWSLNVINNMSQPVYSRIPPPDNLFKHLSLPVDNLIIKKTIL